MGEKATFEIRKKRHLHTWLLNLLLKGLNSSSLENSDVQNNNKLNDLHTMNHRWRKWPDWFTEYIVIVERGLLLHKSH